MRICLISREYPPETGFGGIATFTRHLAHGLKEIGHEVEVVSLCKDDSPDHIQDDDGIIVHR
ncbi:MAG TPA: glycogen/starch synthase, partial [Candidatus Melainabacteria bacterium]|nr:glycogen/starch synthase [Candidatus Melainabacteria bacterium]